MKYESFCSQDIFVYDWLAERYAQKEKRKRDGRSIMSKTTFLMELKNPITVIMFNYDRVGRCT